jgi:hypothetical protein
LLPNDLLQTDQERARPYEWRGVDSLLAKMLTGTITDFLRGDYWAKEDVAGRVGHGIFSFGQLCEFFGLDVEAVKKKMKRMTLKKWLNKKRSFGTRIIHARAREK